MTKRQKQRIEQQLQAKALDLQEELARLRDKLTLEPGGDSADYQRAVADRGSTILAVNRGMELMSRVASALAALESGSYGMCAQCEEPIGEKRLRAVPWATLCVQCRSKIEDGRAA